jgi:hypothetical protein
MPFLKNKWSSNIYRIDLAQRYQVQDYLIISFNELPFLTKNKYLTCDKQRQMQKLTLPYHPPMHHPLKTHNHN